MALCRVSCGSCFSCEADGAESRVAARSFRAERGQQAGAVADRARRDMDDVERGSGWALMIHPEPRTAHLYATGADPLWRNVAPLPCRLAAEVEKPFGHSFRSALARAKRPRRTGEFG
jgi:hypothetical protein